MEVASLKETIQRLKAQNKKLSEKLKAQYEHLKNVEEKGKLEEEKNKTNENTVLCVNRLWTQLQEDIYRLYKAGNFKCTKDDDGGFNQIINNVEDSKLLDPFTTKLINYYAVSVREETSEIVSHLKYLEKLSSNVETNLKTLIDEIKSVRSLGANGIEQLRNEGSVGNRCDIENWQALKRVILERARVMEDKYYQKEAQLKAVKEEMSNTQSELELYHMKVFSMKDTISDLEKKLMAKPDPQPVQPPVVLAPQKEDAEANVEEVRVLSENEEIEKLRTELESAKVKLDKEEEVLIRTQKELKMMELSMKNEQWVTNTMTYKCLLEKKNELEQELNNKKIEIDSLNFKIRQRENDQMSKYSNDLNAQLAISKLLQDSQKKISNLQQELLAADRAKMKYEYAQIENLSWHHLKTAKELKLTIKTLEDELARAANRISIQKSEDDKIEILEEEAIEAAKSRKALQITIGRLEEKIAKLEALLKDHKEKNLEHLKTIEDLKAFIEVLMLTQKEGWNAPSVTASETRLIGELAKSKHKNDVLKLKIKSIESSNSRCKMAERVAELEIRLCEREKKYAMLVKQLEKQRGLQKGFENEIEETGCAYEDVQSQNLRLLQQLSERDEMIDELRCETKKIESKMSETEAEKKNLISQLEANKASIQSLSETIGLHEKKSNELYLEIRNKEAEIRKIQKSLEIVKSEKLELETKIENINFDFEASQRTCNELEHEIKKEIEIALKERNRRQRAEAEINRMRGLGKYSKGGFAQIGEDISDYNQLNEEVEALRCMLRCSVCSTNQKSVILSKCNHIFCSECIFSRLAIRNRKCPACGSSFSQAEVKKFYLT